MPLNIGPQYMRSGVAIAGVTIAGPIIIYILFTAFGFTFMGIMMLVFSPSSEAPSWMDDDPFFDNSRKRHESFGNTTRNIGIFFLVTGIVMMIGGFSCCYLAYSKTRQMMSNQPTAGATGNQPGHIYTPQPGTYPPPQPSPQPGTYPPPGGTYPPQPYSGVTYQPSNIAGYPPQQPPPASIPLAPYPTGTQDSGYPPQYPGASQPYMDTPGFQQPYTDTPSYPMETKPMSAPPYPGDTMTSLQPETQPAYNPNY